LGIANEILKKSQDCDSDEGQPATGTRVVLATSTRLKARSCHLEAAHFDLVVGQWLLEREVCALARLAIDGNVLPKRWL
jgi:hypothetical protein